MPRRRLLQRPGYGTGEAPWSVRLVRTSLPRLPSAEFFHNNNATDETCNSYQAKGHDVGLQCSAESYCYTCAPGEGCSAIAPESYWSVGVSEYGNLKGDAQIKAEIFARGPVSCGIAVTPAFEAYTGGIFHDTTGRKTAADIDHAINIVGWGQDPSTGEDYWIMKNSWGTPWGERGYARVTTNRTENMCLDCDCVFGVPTPPKAPTAAVPATVDGKAIKFHAKTAGTYHRVPKNSWKGGQVITAPLPADTVPTSSLPANWDWRQQGKVLLASADKNQHIPQYCGSCWSQGTTSALSDRLAIATDGQWPAVNLAPQVVINFGGCGNCQGGEPSCVYQFVHDHGVPDQTCQQYMAENGQYDAMGICETCHPTQAHFWPGQCDAVKNFTSWYVGDFGSVSGVEAMQKEIYARGPISCGVQVTPEFETFTGDGIFNQPVANPQIDHEISIAGWGTDPSSGVKYWLLRNSWGTSWGYKGWAKVAFGSIGVEDDCSWGVPQTYPNSNTGSTSSTSYYKNSE